MDPSKCELVLRRLAAAEEAVARARDHAARQREVVSRLEAAEHDASNARQLLASFEAAQANHERRLAMLVDELTRCGWKLSEPCQAELTGERPDKAPP
jgi:hypothetical protein